MSGTNIVYRKARPQDLLPAAKMILKSLNALRAQTGKKIMKRPVRKAPPFAVHLHKTNPGLCYCAWHGKQVVGLALAALRGKQWYLSDLFVHPRYQDKKIGKRLMDRVWRDEPGMSHALCTFAYNMQAIGIYSRYGMSVLESLALLAANGEQFKKPQATGLTVVNKPSKADMAWIHALEKRIRGYEHPTEWSFWLKNKNFRLRIYKDGARRVGYCLSTLDGFFGPVGAISHRYLVRVLTEHLASLELDKKQSIRMFCPTSNTDAYHLLLKCGCRLKELTVFMSDKRYGDFQKYLPADLSVL